MRSLKSSFGIAGALLPVVYCAGLIYYFLDFSGSVQEAEAIGSLPTLLGLGVVGLLFSIPLFLKIVRMLTRRPSPGANSEASDGGDRVDADAAIARYKAQRAAQTPVTPPPPPKPAPKNPGPKKPAFGRR